MRFIFDSDVSYLAGFFYNIQPYLTMSMSIGLFDDEEFNRDPYNTPIKHNQLLMELRLQQLPDHLINADLAEAIDCLIQVKEDEQGNKLEQSPKLWIIPEWHNEYPAMEKFITEYFPNLIEYLRLPSWYIQNQGCIK